MNRIALVNPLNAELTPVRHLLALVGARHILHVSRVRVKPNSTQVQNVGFGLITKPSLELRNYVKNEYLISFMSSVCCWRDSLPVCQGLLIQEVSRSHRMMHHTRQDSSVRVISPTQRPLADNTQHS